jgi:hypothetical protein
MFFYKNSSNGQIVNIKEELFICKLFHLPVALAERSEAVIAGSNPALDLDV